MSEEKKGTKFNNLKIEDIYDIGVDKVQSAKNEMIKINPDITVNAMKTYVNSDNIIDIIKIQSCRCIKYRNY